MPSALADVTEVIGQVLEARDVIDVGGRVLFAVIQSQIVFHRHSFGNYSAEFLPVQSFGILRGREIDHIPSAKAMDDLKDELPKLPEHRLFVTEKNFAVFGESTRRGDITQSCYESIVEAGIELPE
jgi:hypothetical protein